MTSLLGIQIPAPERAADPPNVAAFSTTSTLRPRLAAVRAAVMPAAPAPTTTTSYVALAASAMPLRVVKARAPAPVTAAPRRTSLRDRDSGMGGSLRRDAECYGTSRPVPV